MLKAFCGNKKNQSNMQGYRQNSLVRHRKDYSFIGRNVKNVYRKKQGKIDVAGYQ